MEKYENSKFSGRLTVKEVKVYIPVEFHAFITSITRFINFFMIEICNFSAAFSVQKGPIIP